MIRLTKHALEAIVTRRIPLEWVIAAIEAPDRIAPDPRYPGRVRSHKRIPAFGGRILRVVHRSAGSDIIVITVHFDRRAKL
jgi:hypothetical protein